MMTPYLKYILLTKHETNLTLTVTEVKNIMVTLNTTKAAGPDRLHNKLLVAAANIISQPLTKFFNRCLDECIFPQNL